jgi:hypothetical protein
MTTLVENIRQMILYSFMALPVMLMAFTLFLGFGLGNIGLILLLMGQVFFVPGIVFLSNLIFSAVSSLAPLTQVVNSDICNLVPSAKQLGLLSVAPSYWNAHVLFFGSYLVSNAVALYNEIPQENAPEAKVRHRKDQALTAAIVSSIAMAVLVLLRLFTTGCETILGTAVAALIAVPSGVAWYYFASICGARNSDIFGIAGKMLPPGASEPPPMMCVYKA